MSMYLEKLKKLKESCDELNILNINDLIILNNEIYKNNPKAIELRDWHNKLKKFYIDTKEALQNDETIDFNLEEVGQPPYTIEDFKEEIDEGHVSVYKIAPYIDVVFNDKRINLIDFKRHLKREIALNRKIVWSDDGRPTVANYSLNGVIMAKIYFSFTFDSTTEYMTSRKQELVYIKNDDSEGEKVLIKEEVFDITDINDLTTLLDERVESRQNIVTNLKMIMIGFIKANNSDLNLKECIALTIPYLNTYKDLINNYINLDSDEWKDSMQNLTEDELNTYSFFKIQHPSGVTVREYVLTRL